MMSDDPDDGFFDPLDLEGAEQVPAPDNVQVVPYQALMMAMEEAGEDFEPPSEHSPEYQATWDLAQRENSIGGTFEFEETSGFEGELFIAPVDARFRSDGTVEFTRFYVVEGALQGELAWVGNSVNFWESPTSVIATKCCDNPCGGYGKPGVESDDPLCDPGGDGGKPCGPDMSCQRFGFEAMLQEMGWGLALKTTRRASSAKSSTTRI